MLPVAVSGRNWNKSVGRAPPQPSTQQPDHTKRADDKHDQRCRDAGRDSRTGCHHQSQVHAETKTGHRENCEQQAGIVSNR